MPVGPAGRSSSGCEGGDPGSGPANPAQGFERRTTRRRRRARRRLTATTRRARAALSCTNGVPAGWSFLGEG
ncbi:hypothetical protein HBB16_18255 [Pseudonocardia sp. MCCB 268]|nr:hypothetical protein [Pseudonocardia cytotoxica]